MMQGIRETVQWSIIYTEYVLYEEGGGVEVWEMKSNTWGERSGDK